MKPHRLTVVGLASSLLLLSGGADQPTRSCPPVEQ